MSITNRQRLNEITFNMDVPYSLMELDITPSEVCYGIWLPRNRTKSYSNSELLIMRSDREIISTIKII